MIGEVTSKMPTMSQVSCVIMTSNQVPPSYTATLCTRQGVYWHGPCSRGILFAGQAVWPRGELYVRSLETLVLYCDQSLLLL